MVTELKPVIVYLTTENDDRGITMPERAAHMFLLENELGCRVMSKMELPQPYEPDFLQAIRILNRSLLMFMMVDDDSPEFIREEIQAIRNQFDVDCPTVVFSRQGGSEFSEIRRNVYSVDRSSPQLTDFIMQKRDEWLRAQQYDRASIHQEMEFLLQAYNANEDEGRLPTGIDDNSKIVIEFLRCNLLPIDVIKEEYDDTLHSPISTQESEPDIYSQEVDRISKMDEEKRKAFQDLLLANMGKERNPQGLIYSKRVSKGKNIGDFAIDEATLMWVQLKGVGSHGGARETLDGNLDALDVLKHRTSRKKSRKIFEGPIHFEIPGFTTPIVQIGFPMVPPADRIKYEADYQRIGSHLLSKRQLIPIDWTGRLINSTYSVSRAMADLDLF